MSQAGKLLRVNLTTKAIATEDVNQVWKEHYLSGKGLGTKYVYEELAPKIDPLSPENKLVIMSGLFAGTFVPCSGKLSIATKSPATGTILECSIGGQFSGELKYAGYEGIIIEGKSDHPVYLNIKDENVEICDAQDLWGKGTQETELVLRKKIDREVKVLSIGPAGENLVTMSCISSEFYRQAGRGGVGAVMGSKNLKAIIVRGSGGVSIPHIKEVMEKVKDLVVNDLLTDYNLWAYHDGTQGLVDYCNESGMLPTHNYQRGVFDNHIQINLDSFKKAQTMRKACLSCALGCGGYIEMGSQRMEGPEYETLALAGSNCGISDLEAIVKFNGLCDDLGLDTISCGNTIGFAMELTEKGIKDFGLQFGDIEEYLKIPGLIATREGIGAELCLGVKKLAEKYGGREFAMHVKGLELAGYDPRAAWGMGLAYGTCDRGGCHMGAWSIGDEQASEAGPYSITGKAELVIYLQHFNAVRHSALCNFWYIGLDTLASLVTDVTGRTVTAKDLEVIGERIVNTARQFNVREGFSKKDDFLPERIFNEVLPSGAAQGQKIPLEAYEKMLSEYYSLRGWNQEGIPLMEKLQELQI